jgi:hypothetical protein
MPVPAATLTANAARLRRGPADETSITSGSSPGPSATHLNSPFTGSRMSMYSRLARMHGGSFASSLMVLLLATIRAPSSAWPSALRAGSETLAFSPLSDQLS